ncbi:MAG TPA: hypothetical protein VMU06_20735 [Stellaceae bacterium]|nr:hypothetical protein [Stellaceae bacterium]
MQLILTGSDLEKMPPQLRRDLLRFLLIGAMRPAELPPSEGTAAEPTTAARGLAVLSRRHAIDLVRELSFQREGRTLLATLRALVRHKGEKDTTRAEMAKVVETASALEPNLGALERVLHKVTGDKSLKLWRSVSAGRKYRIHPTTRGVLQDVLEELSHAGEHEEALWE